ncbi:hypothetical protein [uncultured Psychrobacter sp.]|mgnify:CR=1 FL=1|uniref:hypothetical protein n=1 Tax=uncultured Psychrobacter sp. TaxID=259303 RepID=UPI0030DA458F
MTSPLQEKETTVSGYIAEAIKLVASSDLLCLTALEKEDSTADDNFDYFDEELLQVILDSKVDVGDSATNINQWRTQSGSIEGDEAHVSLLESGYAEIISKVNSLAAGQSELNYIDSLIKTCRTQIESQLSFDIIERTHVDRKDLIGTSDAIKYEFDVKVLGCQFKVKMSQILNERGRIKIYTLPKIKAEPGTIDGTVQAYLSDVLECYFYGWCILDTNVIPKR